MRSISISIAAAIALLAVAVALGDLPAVAAPPALNCTAANAGITAPQSGATLSGIVQIEGNASLGGDFQYYKLEFSTEGRDAYNVIGGLARQSVTGGQLGVWDSASVPDGAYVIRLRVVDKTGNYCETQVAGLQVKNSAPAKPTETPTPVETEATPEFSVVPTAMPTIQLPAGELTSGQAQPTAEATPSGTKTPSSGTSLIPGGLGLDSITQAVGNLLSGYLRAFAFGIAAMAGIMLVIGVIFYVRRVL